MVLSSQQARPGTVRSNMFARRTPRSLRWLKVVVPMAAVVLIVWAAWPTGKNRQSSMLPPANSSGGKPAGTDLPADRHETTEQAGLLGSGSQRSSTTPIQNPGAQPEGSPLLPPGNNPGRETDAPGGPASRSGALTMGQDAASVPPSAAGTDGATGSIPPNAVGPRLTTRAPDIQGDPEVMRIMQAAASLVSQKKLVEARARYNAALENPRVGEVADEIRDRMREINAILIFSPQIFPDDPFEAGHVVASGDRLVHIARDNNLDYRFLQQINNISDPGKIRLGQTIKVIRGPFHVVINKSAFRLDLYLGEPDAGGHRMYIRSFQVGLGKDGGTPVGAFRVRVGGKAVNPSWTNPRTNEHFDANDPKNPVGDYWIGIEGTDPQTKTLESYGIHGTIDPASIGHQESMGCIRLRDDDIRILYGMLVEGKSTVTIRP